MIYNQSNYLEALCLNISIKSLTNIKSVNGHFTASLSNKYDVLPFGMDTP